VKLGSIVRNRTYSAAAVTPGARMNVAMPVHMELLAGASALTDTVNGRWLNVPPDGSPRGPISVDYLEPTGIWRDVSLYAVHQTFIRDVFARPVDVLDAGLHVEVSCTVAQGHLSVPDGLPAHLRTELRDGNRVISASQSSVDGETTALTLANLGDIALCHPNTPTSL
jgi:beta-galactosidase